MPHGSLARNGTVKVMLFEAAERLNARELLDDARQHLERVEKKNWTFLVEPMSG